MKLCRYFFQTSVGRKQMVGLTGLLLGLFVLIHMSGNLLLFVGPEAYNRYSHNLTNNEFIYVAEAILLAAFLLHIFLAARLTVTNGRARPVAPRREARSGEKDARFGSRSMILTGLLVLVFVVLHLITFKFGAYYNATYGGVEMRDLYRLVVEKFREPLYVAWYLFALIVLGVHLSHGLAASFQSLGFSSVRRKQVKRLGWAFALVIAVGFISQPIYLYLTGGK